MRQTACVRRSLAGMIGGGTRGREPMPGMRRREFIALTSGAAVAWPLRASAQQPALPVVGFLSALARDDRPNLTEAFRRGLAEAGYVEGRNVTIEYRFADNQYARLPMLAGDLVARKVAVISAGGGGGAVLAAKAATTTVPIVFLTGGDPIQEGFVGSLNRPGGNLTGISWFGTMVAAKALGLLHELVPGAALVGLMVNPNLPESARTQNDAREAARTSVANSSSCKRALRPIFTPPSLRCVNGGPAYCSWGATRSSPLD